MTWRHTDSEQDTMNSRGVEWGGAAAPPPGEDPPPLPPSRICPFSLWVNYMLLGCRSRTVVINKEPQLLRLARMRTRKQYDKSIMRMIYR